MIVFCIMLYVLLQGTLSMALSYLFFVLLFSKMFYEMSKGMGSVLVFFIYGAGLVVITVYMLSYSTYFFSGEVDKRLLLFVLVFLGSYVFFKVDEGSSFLSLYFSQFSLVLLSVFLVVVAMIVLNKIFKEKVGNRKV